MNQLVAIKKVKGKDDVFTTSMIIAKGTKNQHKSVASLIRKHKQRFERWGKVRFSDLKSPNPKGGRPTKIAELNEEQAYYLITLLDNNDIVAEFKAELVDQFFQMRKEIFSRQEARIRGKGVRHEFTDAIKEFVELAESQGHYGTAKFAYSNFSKLIKKPFGVRDGAEAGQLAMIAATEHILGCTIYAMVRTGADAKDIYSNVSTKAKALTGVMLPALEA
jgi:phage regulator Rha-like protein